MTNKNKNKNLPRFAGKAGKIINLKRFNIALFLLIIVGGVYFLTGINDLTVKGFKLQELKVEASELNEGINNLEEEVMALEAYNNLNKRIDELDMVSVGKIDYLSSSGGVAVVK